MWSALYRLKASSCWFTHSFNRWREKKFVLTWQRTLLMKEQLVVTLHLTFVASKNFWEIALLVIYFQWKPSAAHIRARLLHYLFGQPRGREYFYWRAEGIFDTTSICDVPLANGLINVVFVTQPLKIDIPNPDRYDECQVYTSCGGRKTKKDQSADQHWSHLALGSPEPVTCRAPAWSRYRNMRRLKKWPFTQSNGFCLPKG